MGSEDPGDEAHDKRLFTLTVKRQDSLIFLSYFMPKLPGLFDSFDDLDQISPEGIASWLKPVPDLNQLENYLANKILYPQTVPLTELDMQIDLSILREILKLSVPKPGSQKANGLLGENPLLNITLRKVLIPIRFLSFIPDLLSLVRVFIDALLVNRERKDFFQDIWTVVLTGDVDEVVGSILLPQFEGSSGVMYLTALSKNYQIRPNNLTVIPCPKGRCEIAYKLQQGMLLGKQENAFEVYGGKLGLIIDGRSA